MRVTENGCPQYDLVFVLVLQFQVCFYHWCSISLAVIHEKTFMKGVSIVDNYDMDTGRVGRHFRYHTRHHAALQTLSVERIGTQTRRGHYTGSVMWNVLIYTVSHKNGDCNFVK